LTTTPVLAHPDFDKPFYLLTDGSAEGLGAVLSQLNENGMEQVIAYASKTLQGAQKNYSATELECLAVIWAVEHFHHYLDIKPFIILTDHSALTWLHTSPMKGHRARWILRLQPYDFIIKHRPGKENKNADALSRL
jgi:ribonuclease HI